jgi:hypothetical protein
MTKAQQEALRDLLHEIETLRCWLDDTGYPRRSKALLDESVERAREVFAIQLPLESRDEIQ